MATGKKTTAEYIMTLGLCYTLEDARAASVAAGRDPDAEWETADVMTERSLTYDDAMFFACREEIMPPEVLRQFATKVAQEELPLVTKGLGPASVPFTAAVNAMVAGDSLDEHAETVQKAMVTTLAIEGPGDMGDPDKIVAYKRLTAACKAIRAATKPSPGAAAYAAANWVYKGVPKANRDAVGWKHRGMLAKLFREF